jgi:hypothetical protein
MQIYHGRRRINNWGERVIRDNYVIYNGMPIVTNYLVLVFSLEDIKYLCVYTFLSHLMVLNRDHVHVRNSFSPCLNDMYISQCSVHLNYSESWLLAWLAAIIYRGRSEINLKHFCPHDSFTKWFF